MAFKNELLVEMSGVNCNSKSNFIVVLAATNIPETVDPAFLSRFRYKLFVPLPTPEERVTIVENVCAKFNITLTDDASAYIRQKTTGYSSRDIVGVLESLKYIPMRKTLVAKYFKVAEKEVSGKKYIATWDTDENGFEEDATVLGLDNIIRPPILEEDVLEVFRNCAPPRQDVSMGLMQFARKYCNTQQVEQQQRNDENCVQLCCVAMLMCCFWGK
ncbi:unnamed protein product [Allacma fusca]|uniref:ATPase AAA-type core domain-containing protein n=1 Tax=Allacma fusca TaxID=39272 RepID=A0A8J2KFC4_9HEXA|nr:unnamed protein product [Allacma fusca]